MSNVTNDTASFVLTLQIFYITLYIGSYNENDHIIFPTTHMPGSRNSILSNPLTTVFYPDDQISSYQRTLSSTTPMPSITMITNLSQIARNFDSEAMKSDRNTTMWYPSNHKRQYSNVHRHKSGFESNVVAPKKSTMYPNSLEKRTFFPEYDDIDYADNYRNVNSIQDILNQSNQNENIDNGINSSSMPFSRAMKVEGFYRREKKKRDQLDTMETTQSGTLISMYDGKNVRDIQRKDPFSKFKPHSPGDVNLLASNIMKIKQYTLHRPRPVTTPMTLHNYYEDFYGSQDPNIIYHQIIAANNKNREASARNRRFEKPMKNNKPFSLMLDVYPMPEDELQAQFSSTRMTPYIPYNQHQWPFHPVNSQAINHNLQYTKDNAFYNHLKFPQLQPYSHIRSPNVMPHNSKDEFYRDYVTHRTNSNGYRPILKPPRSSPIDLPAEERPSQITVHLNLYPDQKKYPTRNLEIINTAESARNPSRDDSFLWKRLEHSENATKFPSIEVESAHKPYIPPFSAIKINALQPPFDISDSNLLLQPEPPDRSIDYDMVSFDSKKLIPHIKPMNIVNPTANSIVSTASYFDDVQSTISTELPSTLSTDFETTMSSSIYSSAIDHFPFFSTKIPFETTAVTEVSNESKSEQPTIIGGNTIQFQD